MNTPIIAILVVLIILSPKIYDWITDAQDAKREKEKKYKSLEAENCKLLAENAELSQQISENALLKDELSILREKYQNIANAPQATHNAKSSSNQTNSQSKREIKKLTDELSQKTSENKSLKSTLKRVEKENEELKVSLQKSTQLSAKSNTRNYSQNISLPIDDIIVKRLSSPTQFEKIDVCWDSRTLALYKNGVKDGRLTKAINEKTYTRFSSPVQLSIDKILDFSVEVTPHDKKERQRLSQKNSNSFYTTTLKNCSCYYFQNTSSGMAACKHMFALALYLNVITPDGKFNDSISIQKNIL